MAKTKVTAPGIADDAVTVDKLPNTSVTNAKLANSSITINGTSVALGGAITGVGTQSFPTVTAVSPAVITNAQTSVTVTGTNFVSIPIVEAINTSGAITTADTVVFVSATSLTVTFTLPVDGTYYIRVENVTTGLAGRSSSAFSIVNYDPLIVAWEAYGTNNVIFSAGTAHYSAGAPTTAHDAMVVRGWTITDGGTP
jgi:hypothetical protein